MMDTETHQYWQKVLAELENIRILLQLLLDRADDKSTEAFENRIKNNVLSIIK
jgi:hypothetical protein